jgi:hypothetical protein
VRIEKKERAAMAATAIAADVIFFHVYLYLIK